MKDIRFGKTQRKMFEIGKFAPLLLWKPVVEYDFGQERFLSEDPTKLYQKGKVARVPVLAGITANGFLQPTIGKCQSFAVLMPPRAPSNRFQMNVIVMFLFVPFYELFDAIRRYP